MRIVHVIWAFPIGGTETMIVELVNRQCLKAKITLIIINNYLNVDLVNQIHKSVKIIRINRPSKSKNILYFLKLWFSVFFSKAHIIHCHNENICKLLPGFKKKTYLTVHAISFIPKYFKYYNKVFAISKSVKDYIFRESAINSTLIYNGIDINSIKAKQQFDFECFKIVQISRLDHHIKGQDVLINAMKYLVFDLGIKNIQLDFIGGGLSLEYLKSLVSSNMIEEYVNFKGEIQKSDIYNTICDYNLLAQPSICEGFGLTIIEGMVAKIPVLVSNVDGPIEIIQNGLFGSYFKSGDHIDCASKIRDIILNYSFYTSNDRLEKIREYAVANYDISVTADYYLNEYKNR